MLPFAMAAMAFTYIVDGVEYKCDSSEKTAYVTYFKADGSAGADIVIPEKIKARINQYVDFTEYTVTGIDLEHLYINTDRYKFIKSIHAPYIVRFSSRAALPELTDLEFGDNLEWLSCHITPTKLKTIKWNPKTIRVVSGIFYNNKEIDFGKLVFENATNLNFEGCTKLKSVDMGKVPLTAKGIYFSFKNSGLTQITFPKELQQISKGAFEGCSELYPGNNGTLYLPETCTSIFENAFKGCSKLKHVVASGWQVSKYAFSDEKYKKYSQFEDCTSLESVTLSNNMMYIPEKAFKGCVNLKYIRDKAHQNQTVVVFPETIKAIGEYAFSDCVSLTNPLKDRDIKMPKSIEEVRQYAFENCSKLLSISFPDPQKVKRDIIAYTNSFANCTNLKNIDLQEPEKVDDSQDNPSRLQASTMAKAEYSTTYGLVVSRGAFQGCTSLSSIPAPASVKSWTKGYNEGWIINTLHTPYYVKNVTTEDIDALVHPNIFSLSDIKNVYFHSATASVSQGALSSCINVDRVVFYAPETEEQGEAQILQIAPNAFAANKKLVNVECDYLVPPVIEENVFNNETYKTGCLTVPEGTLELYRKANGWKNFSLITDGQLTSISQIEASGNDCPAEFFDLQGRPVNCENAAPGIYIRRQGSTSSKVVIR